jgi:glycosyltransferase involved in cell wall biosynthesis
MQEVVIPGETGLLVSRRDVKAMANALMTYQQMSDHEVSHLRMNAWEKIKADFSQPQQIQKFVELYQSLS